METDTAGADRGRIGLRLSDVLAALALLVALATWYWAALRPGHLVASLVNISETRHGGAHLSLPLSVSNDGAQAVTVLNAKVLETYDNLQTLYDVALISLPEKAVEPMNGIASKENSAVFLPFLVSPNAEVQRLLIFFPVHTNNGNQWLLGSTEKTVSYKLILHTAHGDVSIPFSAAWPPSTTKLLDTNRGVTVPVSDIATWQEAIPQ